MTIPTALVVFDPVERIAQVYYRDLPKKDFAKAKGKEGTVIEENDLAKWELSKEEGLFPHGWVPKEWIYNLAEEPGEDDFYVDSDESVDRLIEEDDASSYEEDQEESHEEEDVEEEDDQEESDEEDQGEEGSEDDQEERDEEDQEGDQGEEE